MDFNRNTLQDLRLKDFEEGLQESERGGIPFGQFLFPLGILCVVALLSYGWYQEYYLDGKSGGDGSDKIPYIHASDGPIRVKPDDPGGMYIANQDKTVYEAISNVKPEKGQGELPKVIRILPTPEEPLDRGQLFDKKESEELEVAQVLSQMSENISDNSGKRIEPVNIDEQQSGSYSSDKNEQVQYNIKKVASDEIKVYFVDSEAQDVNSKDLVEKDINKKEIEKLASSEVSEKDAKESVSQANPEPVKKLITEESPKEKKAQSKPAAVKTQQEAPSITIKKIPLPIRKEKVMTQSSPSANSSVGEHVLQLGAFRSSGDVEKTWASLQKSFPKLLSGRKHFTERADLGEKGVFFRLKVGGFENEAAARSVCSQLRENKRGCIFVGK